MKPRFEASTFTICYHKVKISYS